jgi:hypothetical protein
LLIAVAATTTIATGDLLLSVPQNYLMSGLVINNFD